MKISIAQLKIVPHKGDLNTDHASLMAQLHCLDATSIDVVVTPECFLDGYVCTEAEVTATNIDAYAIDPATSSFVDEVAAWAKATETWVIMGCMRQDTSGIYNTALALDRSGVLVGHYDKVHCQTHDQKYAAGNSLPVFDSDFAKFGLMICADRRWPETVRTLALKGAQIIFNPTYGMHNDKNLRMMQTRSYESEIFIAFTHPQQALITDPQGEIVVNNENDEEGLVITEIDLSLVTQVQGTPSAHLRDRRPDVYDG